MRRSMLNKNTLRPEIRVDSLFLTRFSQDLRRWSVPAIEGLSDPPSLEVGTLILFVVGGRFQVYSGPFTS